MTLAAAARTFAHVLQPAGLTAHVRARWISDGAGLAGAGGRKDFMPRMSPRRALRR